METYWLRVDDNDGMNDFISSSTVIPWECS